MKRIEYEKKMNEMNVSLEKLNIFLGRKTIIPFSIGCYEEDNIWYLYIVGEEQNLSIAEKGDEEKIFEYLNMITLSELGR